MKSVLLIGLGRFGRHVARKLNEMNHQVLAVDKNEKRVEDALPYLTSAQIGNFHLLFHLHESTMPNRIKHCFIKFIFFLSQFIFQQFLCLALNPLQSIIHRLGAFSEKLCDFPVIRSHQVQFQHMILQRT